MQQKQVRPLPRQTQVPLFHSKPNLYLVGFDALLPPSLASKLLQLEDLQYVAALQETGFRLVKNSFGEVNTATALQALVTMQGASTATREAESAVTDLASPLYQFFKGNGYQVQLVVRSPFFGGQGTSNLDALILAHPMAGACEHNSLPGGLMGYCLPWVQGFLSQYLFPQQPWPDLLFQRIRETAAAPGPWLTLGYIFSPGHVWTGFNQNNPQDVQTYRNAFATQSDKVTAGYLRSLMQTIKTHDPQAVVVVFGDHGSHVTWGSGISHRELLGNLPPHPNPELLKAVQDHRGALIAVYPKEFCPEEFQQEPYPLSRLGRSLVKCLSGHDPQPGESAAEAALRPYLYE